MKCVILQIDEPTPTDITLKEHLSCTTQQRTHIGMCLVCTRKTTCCIKCFNKFVFNDLLFVSVCLTINRHNVLQNYKQTSWLQPNAYWSFGVESLSMAHHFWGLYFHSHLIKLLI